LIIAGYILNNELLAENLTLFVQVSPEMATGKPGAGVLDSSFKGGHVSLLRIACISDTHLNESSVQVPECDMLIHAGDMTMLDASEHSLVDFDGWCSSLALDRSRILVCAGNHDLPLQNNRNARKLLRHCTYLCDESIIIEGLKFYASPWQPAFFNLAFNLERDSQDLKKKWDEIPDDTDILITHAPPYGLGDLLSPGEHLGCRLLLERIKKVRPRLHVCGHIHSGQGIYKTDFNTTVINASVCNNSYKPVNQPVVIEI